ncbi:dopamine N-acetyltransferase-like [Drosophila novamexicana]|uniref:dopamine N-acetyltransferase-like n=1 Tax=Drosophila novamexicana TaxID=47314 RepID=UPI0011E5A480|nr:dopamine N-acetyltransferase-like [Drosophila novamexicana]
MSTIVREMKAADIEEATRFLREHFYTGEPLLQSYAEKQQIILDTNKRAYKESCIQQGTSLVAVDQSKDDRIVGVAYTGALNAKQLEQNWKELNREKRTQFMEHVKYYLINIKRNAQFFEQYGVSDVLYLKVLAVDSAVRRQGVARRLVTALIDVGRAKGYSLLVATCTGLYSTQLMASLGMDCVHSELYCDYKDDDGNVVFKPQAPHTKASVMALKL